MRGARGSEVQAGPSPAGDGRVRAYPQDTRSWGDVKGIEPIETNARALRREPLTPLPQGEWSAMLRLEADVADRRGRGSWPSRRQASAWLG